MTNVEKIKVDIAGSGHITNSYLVYDSETKEGVLIDPGYDEKKIINQIIKSNIDVKYIIITHAHADHIGALEKVQEYTNSKIIINKYDLAALLNLEENYSEILGVRKQNIKSEDVISVEDGYSFSISNMEFEIIHTPGHTSGCICIFEKDSNILFTGDTLFYNCYGRCDLESGDFNKMVDSLKKIYSRFSNIMIYPGHDNAVNIDDTLKRIRLLVALNGGKI
ncbi:MAG: MBL fold metallo-hydrolase [Clostridia bacterium]